MKKQYFLMMLSVLFITLGSCSSDDSGDSDDNINEESIIGEWRLTRERDNDTEEPYDETYPEGCDNVWQFTSTTLSTSWDYDCDGSIDDMGSAAYELDGNRLLINGEDIGEDGERAEVSSLTSNRLTIRIIEPAFDDEPEYIVTFDFERL